MKHDLIFFFFESDFFLFPYTPLWIFYKKKRFLTPPKKKKSLHHDSVDHSLLLGFTVPRLVRYLSTIIYWFQSSQLGSLFFFFLIDDDDHQQVHHLLRHSFYLQYSSYHRSSLSTWSSPSITHSSFFFFFPFQKKPFFHRRDFSPLSTTHPAGNLTYTHTS